MVKDWRKHVDSSLREHLEKEVRQTFAYKKAYDAADNKGNAQLWIALANMAKQMGQLGKKLESVERGLRDLEEKARGMQRGEISFVQDELVDIQNLPEPELPEMPELRDMKELEDVGELIELKPVVKKRGRKPGKIGKKPLKSGKKKLKRALRRF